MRGFAVGAVLVLALSGCAQPPLRTDEVSPSWPMEGGAPSRVSVADRPVPARWRLRLMLDLVPDEGPGAAEYATPGLFNGVAYVGHEGGTFDAVRLEDGSVLWRHPMGGRVYTTPAWADGAWVVADDGGTVRSIDLSGDEKWTFATTYPVASSPVVADGRVYVGVSDQNVFALDVGTGEPLWQYGRRFPHTNALWRGPNLAVAGGRVYAGFSDGTVAALDHEDGSVLWRGQVTPEGVFSDVAAGPVVAGGRVFAGSLGGPLVAFDAVTGSEKWRVSLEVVSGPAVTERLLVVGLAEGAVTALSPSDGGVLWSTEFGGKGIPGAPVIADGAVVVGFSDGALYGLDPATGKVIRHYTPGPGVLAQPLVFDQGILFLSNGGALHWVGK